ncbi:MAG: acyl-CoA dehydratase activase-related protein [Eubacteriales bacterium]|nr:acyl-CoA dehydratase activase-related protein [Eubacteriales bacterium]
MSSKLGIPRGLFYYRFYPLWNEFFKILDVDCIDSGPTNKKILELGSRLCVDEACLPVKIFHGHAASLRDKADFIFVPRYTSISEKEYICPKFGGLPDMLRNCINGLPRIIDTEFNLRKKNSNALKAAAEIGSFFGHSTRDSIFAFSQAKKAFDEYRKMVVAGTFPGDILDNKKNMRSLGKDTLKILLIGHPYNIYDSFVNMNIVEKLRQKGAEVFTVDMFEEKLLKDMAEVLNKRMFWNFGTLALGCTYQILETENTDGIIYLMSFGCGIDAFVCNMAERRVRERSDIPYIVLTIDEHTGEAGIDTRIEAFIDLIRWRKRDEGYISAHG